MLTDRTSLPMKSIARPQEFPKALYTFDIAQNDLSYGFQHSSEEQVKASIPDILNTFSEAVEVGNLNHSLNNAHKNCNDPTFRTHIGWRGERSIPYKGVKTSP